jgi:hypothetical protein
MGLLKSAGDFVYTIRFLTLLVTPFEKSAAYKAGIIDEKGNKNKNFNMDLAANREAYRDSYTSFHRLVFNIKKLMAKVPGGSSRIASYAAALYLIKEKYDIPDKKIEKALRECGIDTLDFMAENTQWFVLEDGRLSPGVYKVTNDKVLNDTFEEVVQENHKIRILDDCYPVGDMFGLNVYEAIHINTNKKIYVTASELMR